MGCPVDAATTEWVGLDVLWMEWPASARQRDQGTFSRGDPSARYHVPEKGVALWSSAQSGVASVGGGLGICNINDANLILIWSELHALKSFEGEKGRRDAVRVDDRLGCEAI